VPVTGTAFDANAVNTKTPGRLPGYFCILSTVCLDEQRLRYEMVFRRGNRPTNQPPQQAGEESRGAEGDILIGHDIDKGEEIRFSLKDWLGHWHVAGPPGVGKTSLLEILIWELLRLKEGFCLIDPWVPSTSASLTTLPGTRSWPRT
jgi:hypothetical protein